ncbi:hypothetical protein MM221_10810 [Salipaludibacillus sp. LMS25]|uniref:hypothetical protein n=1 Tax=Salipaludibacillus sp. LMS25 TaxID=2924031 RepID=UPI0020D19C44|nr:hypothetical protein [Salipaludibacillus sp. LMS25]UTR13148.1 hypothetical protein MM221_10810 [Salipaludibacillus sp. LMS25]
MTYIIIIFSLFISTVVSVLTLKKKNNKWLALLMALCSNTLLLVVATWLVSLINDEVRLFGIGQTNLYLLIFSIPIMTWVTFLILELIRNRVIKMEQ